MYDQKMLDYFRKLLLQQKAALLKQAARTLRENREDSSEQGGDFADIASLESNRTLKLRLRDREQKLMAKIDESLSKIDKGLYGMCESCGCDISIERLKARPVATLCISCKEDQESHES